MADTGDLASITELMIQYCDLIDCGDLAGCAAHNASNWLLGWSDQGALQAGYADQFVESGYSFRELVRSIVRSSAYGRNQ